MLVYKYRGISEIKRDINTLVNNQYYASSFKALNDPFENIFQDNITSSLELIKKELHANVDLCKNILAKILSFNNDVGIYSLTTSPFNELMWAHYASESKGYCIEYEFEKIKEETNYPLQLHLNSLNVEYYNSPPKININDINNPKLLQKIFGAKSKAWKYENEVRILSDKYGIIEYSPDALKAIYFGFSAEENLIQDTISKLTLSELKFYKIRRIHGEYNLQCELIHENKNDKKLDGNNFEFKTKHNPTVENFYIKSFVDFKDNNSVKDFLLQFRAKNATKRANIILYNRTVDLSMIRDTYNNHTYLEDHKIAEIMSGCDDVRFEKIY